MYADYTVVYTYAKTKEQAAIKLIAALNKFSDCHSRPTLNVSKLWEYIFDQKVVEVVQIL